MPAARALASIAALGLLTGCGPTEHAARVADPPLATTTSAATATATATPAARATATATASRSAPAVATASPTPTVRRTTARPVATPTTARPTPVRTTAKPVVTTAPPASGTTQLSISGFAFSPASLSIPRGTTVRATNHDATAHTWTATGGAWDSGDLAQNQSFSYRFMTKGAFSFVCSKHASMTGRVTVT